MESVPQRPSISLRAARPPPVDQIEAVGKSMQQQKRRTKLPDSPATKRRVVAAPRDLRWVEAALSRLSPEEQQALAWAIPLISRLGGS